MVASKIDELQFRRLQEADQAQKSPRQAGAAQGGMAWRIERGNAHRPQWARITLLATAFNNLALAVVVAGFIAPAASGRLHAGWQAVTTLAWIVFGTAIHISGQIVLGRLRQ